MTENFFPIYMQRLKIIFITMLCLMTIATTTEAIMVDRVLATVNNEVVTLSDYKRFVLRAGSSEASEAVDEKQLKKVIDEKLIFLEAKKSGINATESEISQIFREFQKNNKLSDEEIKKRLAEQGMTITDYMILIKQSLISLKFIDREINRKVMVTDDEIDDYYNKNMKLFIEKPERMQVKAIFMKCNAHPTLTEITDLKLKSLKILSEIKKGEPFDKMIGLYADEPLKSREGLLGEFEKGTLITELNMTISSLKEGEVSDPVWTKEGVYVLKMIKKINVSYIPLSQTREHIYKTLYQQKRENKYNEWLKALWEKSSVTIKK
jgi:peptidyl-prolyl cis-trans isomerase SurA